MDVPPRRRFPLAASLALLAGALLVACAPDGETVPDGRVNATLEVVARDLIVPWDLAFAGDGSLFVTERVGRIRVVEDGRLRPEPWATLDVSAIGEAGLMGIALAPDFARSGHVYVVGTFRAAGALVNRIVRLTDSAGAGRDPTVVFGDMPAARFHAGAALEFGPDGMLYVTAGDARRPSAADDRASLAGKILRLTPNGAVPPDNPFGDSPIYAMGVRNSQGLVWHPETGDLLATDHGPSGFPNELGRVGLDELNAIVAGGHYGWPEVAGAVRDRRFHSPLVTWRGFGDHIAPSGIALYTGPELRWRGNVFVGALRGRELRRVILERRTGGPGWEAVAQERWFDGELGRIRAVVMGPDGLLYLTTSNRDGRGEPRPGDDRVLRVVPR